MDLECHRRVATSRLAGESHKELGPGEAAEEVLFGQIESGETPIFSRKNHRSGAGIYWIEGTFFLVEVWGEEANFHFNDSGTKCAVGQMLVAGALRHHWIVWNTFMFTRKSRKWMMKAWKDAFFLLTKEGFDDCGGSQKVPMTPICHLYPLRYLHTDRNRYLCTLIILIHRFELLHWRRRRFTCCGSRVVNLHGIKTGIVYLECLEFGGRTADLRKTCRICAGRVADCSLDKEVWGPPGGYVHNISWIVSKACCQQCLTESQHIIFSNFRGIGGGIVIQTDYTPLLGLMKI